MMLSLRLFFHEQSLKLFGTALKMLLAFLLLWPVLRSAPLCLLLNSRLRLLETLLSNQSTLFASPWVSPVFANLFSLNLRSQHCHFKVYEWVSSAYGFTCFYPDLLQPSTSHCCAYKLPVKHLCLVAPTILSSLGSVQTWEHKYLYQLYTLSWIFISACWTSVFPLHSFILFLCFDSGSETRPGCVKKKKRSFILSWALCKLKARGSLEYFVRHPRKHLRVPWQKKREAKDELSARGVPQGADSGPLTIPKALKDPLQYSMCDNAITHLQVFHSSISISSFSRCW